MVSPGRRGPELMKLSSDSWSLGGPPNEGGGFIGLYTGNDLFVCSEVGGAVDGVVCSRVAGVVLVVVRGVDGCSFSGLNTVPVPRSGSSVVPYRMRDHSFNVALP